MKKFVKAASGSDKLHNVIDRGRWEIRHGRSVDEAIDKLAEEFGFDKDGRILQHVKSVLEDTYIDKKVTAASLVDTFLKYHDDERNYHNNPNGFDEMYEILEKYDDSNGNDTVDVAFRKATPEDQRRMVELITPGSWALKPGDVGYTLKMYKSAFTGDEWLGDASRDYCQGIIDAVNAMIEEHFLSVKDARDFIKARKEYE